MEPKPGPSRSNLSRPSSQQTIEKVEVFEVREHVPYQAEVHRPPGSYQADIHRPAGSYQAELTRLPAAYDAESAESRSSSSWDSAWKSLCQLVNLIHHMLVAIVVFNLWNFALRVTADGSITNLQLHIVFAGTGYQLFLVEAILSLHRHNSWTNKLSQDSRRVIHGCLQLIGAILVIAGTFLALSEVNMSVTTLHGIFGVIALTFALGSLVSGVLALFSSKVRLLVKHGPVKILHVAVGLFGVSMGLVTMILGFNMDYFIVNQGGGLHVALTVFVVLILFYILVQPIVDLVSTTRKML